VAGPGRSPAGWEKLTEKNYTVRIITRAKLLGNRRFSEIREFAAIPPGLDLPSWLEEIQAAPGLFVALEDAPNELSHPIQKVKDREAE
jgi:hypothetical protein